MDSGFAAIQVGIQVPISGKPEIGGAPE
jgi:hypothetical protein